MTTPVVAVAGDAFDRRLTRIASGLLLDFQAAGVITAADIHVAVRLGRLGEEANEQVLLAAALTVRAARLGSVCLDLAAAPTQIVAAQDEEFAADAAGGAVADASNVTELPWPDPQTWMAACQASQLVDSGAAHSGRPLQLVDGLLYLDRYWEQERLVARELAARASHSHDAPPTLDPDRFTAALERLFPSSAGDDGSSPQDDGDQRQAAVVAAGRWLTVLAGGPGTGKTTTVARVLALLADQPGPAPHIALAAPTGKAAARLAEAVRDAIATLPAQDQARLGELTASTLHRLLGFLPGSRSRFRHHAGNRLAHDIVVVDESSMISLTLMSRLLDAVRPDARLILVGDPEQLASVEAGAVLADIVDAAPESDSGIVVLQRSWRFGGRIADLARAVQAGDADVVLDLLRTPAEDVSFVEAQAEVGGAAVGSGSGDALAGLRDDVIAAARLLISAARSGDAAAALRCLGTHRLLCAHRHGPYGVDRWGPELERWIDGALGFIGGGEWYPGRPLLVTANDYELKLFNGDTGVAISDVAGAMTTAFGRPADPVIIRPARLGAVQSMQALTVHRSQGSQFERVSVLLPAEGSPLLTRQLLYTAVTRAEKHVRVIGTEAAVRAAVTTPIVRASGLRDRLWRASS